MVIPLIEFSITCIELCASCHQNPICNQLAGAFQLKMSKRTRFLPMMRRSKHPTNIAARFSRVSRAAEVGLSARSTSKINALITLPIRSASPAGVQVPLLTVQISPQLCRRLASDPSWHCHDPLERLSPFILSANSNGQYSAHATICRVFMLYYRAPFSPAIGLLVFQFSTCPHSRSLHDNHLSTDWTQPRPRPRPSQAVEIFARP